MSKSLTPELDMLTNADSEVRGFDAIHGMLRRIDPVKAQRELRAVKALVRAAKSVHAMHPTSTLGTALRRLARLSGEKGGRK